MIPTVLCGSSLAFGLNHGSVSGVAAGSREFQQPLTESFVFLFPQLTKVTSKVLSEQPKSRQLMTSDQDTKVVAEPQVQQVQEVKDGSHLVSIIIACSPGVSVV